MGTIDQTNRPARLTTPLGENVLALSSLEGTETLNTLYNYTIECISEDAELDLYGVLGLPAGLAIDSQNEGTRYLHGIVNQAAHIGSEGEFARYRLNLTAAPWMMTQTTDCRIFQELSVPDIIKSVLEDNGFTDFDDRLMGQYERWGFCVQYRESDFDFISRLMEHEGIYYYFEHEQSRHVMVLCDGNTAHELVTDYEEVPHFPVSIDQTRKVDHLVDWTFEKTVKSARYASNDFAFDQPKRDLLVLSSEQLQGGYEPHEVYEYPGGYSNNNSGELKRSYGEQLVKMRLESLTARHELAFVKGNVRGLNAGNLFSLVECERSDQNREYLIVSASLDISIDDYFSGGEGIYELKARFKCMPSSITYRPQRLTPKPEIRGPQTAIVVGPAGDEIHTDEHARVKLQFHWDRYGQSDENSSCWIRVSQAWAGEKWGSIHIPRIGQEVIVEYIDGDPDRPIVTGRVYNGDRPVPYDLPANATQSGIKSRSSMSGTPANFNEIRMEDKKGSEELYIHAEKDQNNIVENDETTSVGHDRSEDVGNDETISIGHDRKETVGNDEAIGIGNNRTETVGTDETISIGKNRTEQVGANETIDIGQSRTVNIGMNKAETVKINKAETIGVAKELTIGGKYAVSVGGSVTETFGDILGTTVSKDHSESIGKNQSIEVADNQSVKVGKNIIIDAGDQITIKTGKASIVMKKDGTITLSGKDINIKASGEINQKASKNVVMKGKKILQN